MIWRSISQQTHCDFERFFCGLQQELLQIAQMRLQSPLQEHLTPVACNVPMERQGCDT